MSNLLINAHTLLMLQALHKYMNKWYYVLHTNLF